MPSSIVLYPCLALILSLGLHSLALWLFPKIKLLDFPERYGLTRKRLPYPTGILSVAIFIILFSVMMPMNLKTGSLLIALILLGTLSFIDDRMPLSPALRFSIQALCALIVCLGGALIYTITNPFGGIIKLDTFTVPIPTIGTLPILSAIFTIGWLLLTTNSLNWFDGIPGQVTAVSLTGFLMLGMLALFRTHQIEIALIAFTLASLAAGALLFDFPPAKVIIGDSGSMFFGFMLGLLGVYQGGKVATAFLVLGIALYDAAFVIAWRLLRGKKPWHGGQDHLHHRLLKKGWKPWMIILMLCVFGISYGIWALYADTGEKFLAAGILAAYVGLLTVYSLRRVQRSQ